MQTQTALEVKRCCKESPNNKKVDLSIKRNCAAWGAGERIQPWPGCGFPAADVVEVYVEVLSSLLPLFRDSGGCSVAAVNILQLRQPSRMSCRYVVLLRLAPTRSVEFCCRCVAAASVAVAAGGKTQVLL